jgi:hypothetical protein
MKTGGLLSIWFFIGIALLVNGALILCAGVYELFHVPPEQVVLYHLHANVWWGAILTVIGAAYCICYLPGKGRV